MRRRDILASGRSDLLLTGLSSALARWVLALGLLLVVILWPAAAVAQSDAPASAPVGSPAVTVSVMPGGEKLIVSGSASKIEKESATYGTVSIKTTGDGQMKQDLVFSAPRDGGGKQATVTYTIDGKVQSVQVKILDDLWGTGYEAAFKVLFTMFVLAVVLEWGLSVLFNWRYFLSYFDAGGARTVIAVVFAYWFVQKFDLDVATRLVNVLWMTTHTSDFASKLVSAFVLAGGSAGVNSMMVALGFRAVRTVDSVQLKPPPKKAWLAVYLRADKAVTAHISLSTDNGATFVLLHRLLVLPAKESPQIPFLRDKGRFPGFGGYQLQPGTAYVVRVEGFNEKRASTRKADYELTPGEGAIIDIREAV